MRSRIRLAATMFGIFVSSAAQAASVVTLAPYTAHPSQAVTVSATGFGDSEAVDVYVDTTDTLLLVTTSTRTLSGSVTLPAAAQPGTHYITAIGRKSGDAAQAKINVTTPWLESGFGAAHLNSNPYENTLNASNVPSLGLLWAYNGSGTGSTPAVSPGRVIVGTKAGVQALQPTTGAVLWSALTAEAFYYSPSISGNVYIGGSSGNFYELNLSTGATVWKTALPGYSTIDATPIAATPVVVGNAVYFGINTGVIYALNKSTGAALWSYTTGAEILSAPAVVNGILYIGSDDGNLYAINAANGALVWKYTTGGPVESSPSVANGTVYFGSDDGHVYAVYAKTGGLLWSYNTGTAENYIASPAVGDSNVYIGAQVSQTLYALSAHSGALVWSAKLNALPDSPAVANGVVYVTSEDGSVYAFEAKYGGLLASGTLAGNSFGGPAVSDGIIYINGNNDSIYALALQAGTGAVAPVAPSSKSLHPDMRLALTH